MSQTVKIGTRGSKLALWQAEWVRAELIRRSPDVAFVIKIVKTSGDVQKDASLSLIGGQGVFTKELENALLVHEIDLAVHSLKDLPTILPEELRLGAITEREDARDALVNRSDRRVPGASLLDLEPGSVVGTSSPRRAAQLRALRPDLPVAELRGNIDTRLRKLDAGDYDYIVLACAGLHRLGWGHRIGFPITPDEMLPAVGQGALGIEIRADDAAIAPMMTVLDHPATRAACLAERGFLRAAGGGCQLPLTAFAEIRKGELNVRGLLIEGDAVLHQDLTGPIADAELLGEQLARRMLKELGDANPPPISATT